MLDTLKRHVDIVKDTLKLEREAPAERERRQATAFLPPALEILETPPNPLGRAVLWAVVGFLTLALGWAVIGKVDMVASAQGKLIPAAGSSWSKPRTTASCGPCMSLKARRCARGRRWWSSAPR